MNTKRFKIRFLILPFMIFLGFFYAGAQEFEANFTLAPITSSLISLNAPGSSFGFAAESNILLDSLNQTFAELGLSSLTSQAVSLPEPSAENINALLKTAGTFTDSFISIGSGKTLSSVLGSNLDPTLKSSVFNIIALEGQVGILDLPRTFESLKIEYEINTSNIHIYDRVEIAVALRLLDKVGLTKSDFLFVKDADVLTGILVRYFGEKEANTRAFGAEFRDPNGKLFGVVRIEGANDLTQTVLHEGGHIILDRLIEKNGINVVMPLIAVWLDNQRVTGLKPTDYLDSRATNVSEIFAYTFPFVAQGSEFSPGPMRDLVDTMKYMVFGTPLPSELPSRINPYLAVAGDIPTPKAASANQLLDVAAGIVSALPPLYELQSKAISVGNQKQADDYSNLQRGYFDLLNSLSIRVVSDPNATSNEKKAAEAIGRASQKIEASGRYNAPALKMETALKKAGESQQKANASLNSAQLYQSAADSAHALIFARDSAKAAVEAKKLLGEAALLLNEAAAELKTLRDSASGESKLDYFFDEKVDRRWTSGLRFIIKSPSLALAPKIMLLAAAFDKIGKGTEVVKLALEKARERVESAAAAQITGRTADSLAAVKLDKDALAGELKALAEELQTLLGPDQEISSRAKEITSNISFILDLVRNEKDKLRQEFWTLRLLPRVPFSESLGLSMAYIRGTDIVSKTFNPILKDLENAQTQTSGLESVLTELQTPSKELALDLNNLAAALANIKVSKTSGKLKPVLSFSRDGKNYFGPETFGSDAPQISAELGKPSRFYLSAAKSQGEIAECDWNADLDINSGLSFENRIDRRGECVIELNVTLNSPPYKLYELYTIPVLRLKNKAGEVSEVAQLKVNVVPTLKLKIVDGGIRFGMPIEGESLTFWAKVENPDGATAPHSARFVFNFGDGPPIEAMPATINASELKPGDSLEFTGTWKNLRPGKYDVSAVVEAAKFTSSSFPVFSGVIKSRADIKSAPISISLSAPQQAPKKTASGQFRVDLTADVSGTEQGPINYWLYCNRPDAGTNITAGYKARYGTVPWIHIESGCAYDSPGTYTIKVIVQRGGSAAEARTFINVVANPPPLPPPPSPTLPSGSTVPDFIVKNVSIDATAFKAGEEVTFRGKVKNQGTGYGAYHVFAKVDVFNDGKPNTGTYDYDLGFAKYYPPEFAPLQPGEEREFNQFFTVRSPLGTHGLKVCVEVQQGPGQTVRDSMGYVIYESDTNNNCSDTIAITVTKPSPSLIQRVINNVQTVVQNIVQAVVNVVNPPPSSPIPIQPVADIKAINANKPNLTTLDGPITIPYNSNVILTWYSVNVTNCKISPARSGWTVGTSSGGEATENLTSSQTYTLTCQGPYGTAVDTVQVNVESPKLLSAADIVISSGPTLYEGKFLVNERVKFKAKIKNRGGTPAVAKKEVLNPKLVVEFILDRNNDGEPDQISYTKVLVPNKTSLAPDEEIEFISDFFNLNSSPGPEKITANVRFYDFGDTSTDNNQASLVFDVSEKAVSQPPAKQLNFALENTGNLIINVEAPEDATAMPVAATAKTTLNVKPFDSFNSPVRFFIDSVTPSIQGARFKFSPDTLDFGQYSSGVVLEATLPQGTPKGLYTVVVKGVSASGVERLNRVELQVLLKAIEFRAFREI